MSPNGNPASILKPAPHTGGATHADNENGTLLPPTFGERVLPTMNEDGSRRWIKPRLSHGPFHSARRIFSWVLIGIFTLIPYIRIGGHPLVLLDIAARQFTLFGRMFVPTDTLILLALLLTVFTGVFLFTAVLGRVWCGWACPQTVYLEFVFRPIERFFDNLGKRLALRPDDPKHALFKALRWGAYTIIAMYLAHTFLAYFVGVDRLAIWVRRSPLEHPVSFLVMAGTTFAMLLDFGVFREQICFAACPYGRLQSVLLDRQSLIVGYDEIRGEPRGKMSAAAYISANSPEAKKGDCVDCKACVVTCPTGIDIRDGLQLECIGCTQCIDACDTIMLKLNKPKGLIRYASQDELAGKGRKLVRPRVLIYSVLMTVAASALVYLLTHDRSIDMTLLRGIGEPFSIMADGRIQNQVRVKVRNRTADEHHYRIELPALAGKDGVQFVAPENPFVVKPQELREVTLFVIAPTALFEHGHHDTPVRLTSDDGVTTDKTYRLLAPGADGTDLKRVY